MMTLSKAPRKPVSDYNGLGVQLDKQTKKAEKCRLREKRAWRLVRAAERALEDARDAHRAAREELNAERAKMAAFKTRTSVTLQGVRAAHVHAANLLRERPDDERVVAVHAMAMEDLAAMELIKRRAWAPVELSDSDTDSDTDTDAEAEVEM